MYSLYGDLIYCLDELGINKIILIFDLGENFG